MDNASPVINHGHYDGAHRPTNNSILLGLVQTRRPEKSKQMLETRKGRPSGSDLQPPHYCQLNGILFSNTHECDRCFSRPPEAVATSASQKWRHYHLLPLSHLSASIDPNDAGFSKGRIAWGNQLQSCSLVLIHGGPQWWHGVTQQPHGVS